MDLSSVIDEAKKLNLSLVSHIDKCKQKEIELERTAKFQHTQHINLTAAVKAIDVREAKVAKIENAQAVLNRAEQRNRDAEQKKVELFDREKKLASDEYNLGESVKKLVRDQNDLESKKDDLRRDWTIFNKRKKEFEQKNK